MAKVWRPSGFLTGKPDRPYAALVLNQPINRNALSAVIEAAKYLVCADAGADRLMIYDKDPGVKHRLPDAIVGDLDSLTESTKTYFQDRGVQIVQDPDQYSTDFAKSLQWMRQRSSEDLGQGDDLDVVVLGGLGGRVDQGFSQIHYLYLAQRDSKLLRGRIYLLSEQSLTFILAEGPNEIYLEPSTFEENVGIIPIMGPTRISTQGLEWDVDDWSTEFGGQLSTSNHLRSDEIMIHVAGTEPLLTFELAKHLCVIS